MTQTIVSTWNTVVRKSLQPLKNVPGIALPKKGKKKSSRLEPVPNLSRASKCVWQMDREA